MNFALMFPDSSFFFLVWNSRSFLYSTLIHPTSHATWFTSQLLHMIYVLDYSSEGGDDISKTFGFLIVQSCKIHFFFPANFEQLVLLPRVPHWTTCLHIVQSASCLSKKINFFINWWCCGGYDCGIMKTEVRGGAENDSTYVYVCWTCQSTLIELCTF